MLSQTYINVWVLIQSHPKSAVMWQKFVLMRELPGSKPSMGSAKKAQIHQHFSFKVPLQPDNKFCREQVLPDGRKAELIYLISPNTWMCQDMKLSFQFPRYFKSESTGNCKPWKQMDHLQTFFPNVYIMLCVNGLKQKCWNVWKNNV